MKLVVCENCGKHYNFEKDETCPKCGAFNHPKDRTSSTTVTSSNTVSRQKKSPKSKEEKSRKNTVAACITIGLILLKLFSKAVDHWDFFGSSQPEPDIVTAQEEIYVDEPYQDNFGEGFFYVPLTEEEFSFEPSGGALFFVHECGLMKNAEMQDFVGDGNQCVYADMTFSVLDWDQLDAENLTEPYILANDEYYYAVMPEELENSIEITPIDYTPVAAGESDDAWGDLYFVLPEEIDEFELCWDCDEFVQSLQYQIYE